MADAPDMSGLVRFVADALLRQWKAHDEAKQSGERLEGEEELSESSGPQQEPYQT